MRTDDKALKAIFRSQKMEGKSSLVQTNKYGDFLKPLNLRDFSHSDKTRICKPEKVQAFANINGGKCNPGSVLLPKFRKKLSMDQF